MVARICLLVIFACGLAACGTTRITPTLTASPVSSVTDTPLPTNTPPVTPALEVFTETLAETPSDAPVPPSITATLDAFKATSIAQLGPMGALVNISEYYHPAGTPVETWREVPVMPQATAGQEYPPYVYSYTVNATLDQAHQFYAPLAASLGITFPPGSGSAGTGAETVHNVTFLSQTVVIVLTSFDSDPNHVIVVISKAP